VSEQLAGALIGLGGALFGVLVSGAISLWLQRASVRSDSAEDFREVLEKLVDARIQLFGVMQQHAHDTYGRETLSFAINAKRQLYKSTAARMLKTAKDELTANDCATLGQEYQSDSEFENALMCYEAALDHVGGSVLEHVNALRSLGGFYLAPSTLHDRAQGEDRYRQAVALLDCGDDDDYNRYQLGLTHESWGLGLAARYPGWQEHVDRAREYYESMSVANPLRGYALESLELHLAQRTAQAAPIAPPPQQQQPPATPPAARSRA
jgi:tetratricopeptide (TPR) repeat protein